MDSTKTSSDRKSLAEVWIPFKRGTLGLLMFSLTRHGFRGGVRFGPPGSGNVLTLEAQLPVWWKPRFYRDATRWRAGWLLFAVSWSAAA